ncbi:MAG: filamentous hemagglutinin N-terminal domain-containing protein [Selenomonadaceae bacterium]|nr:filamentous hemagglutinin N-terminal domain-containing protein [Selenomonadaceae bacterium]
MPTVDTSQGAHADYTTKPVAVGNTMEVQGTRANNVIDWTDFSIAKGETVAFQNVGEQAANYMNIVTGHATSNIEGTMTNNGDIYLINPNGVIFGATAQVNVGNLYVSTREDSQVAIDTFRGTNAPPVNDVGTILSAVTMDNALKADVVNLIDTSGYVKANKVVMEGNNIRFLNSSSASNVAGDGNSDITLRANGSGYIHVGDEAGNYAYTAEKITAYATAADAEQQQPAIPATFSDVTGNKATREAAGVVNYALIHNATELQNINYATGDNKAGNAIVGYGLAGNYMLANDLAGAATVKIGSATSDGLSISDGEAFSGKFDGMFYTVAGLNQYDGTDSQYLGLFAQTNGARIENVGVKDARLNGFLAGGIVGYAYNTTLLNVWNEGKTDGSLSVGVIDDNDNLTFSGGIAGYLGNGSTLHSSYNASWAAGAGLVGSLYNSTISNSYNIGKLGTSESESAELGLSAGSNLYGIYNLLVDGDATSRIENTYTASKLYYSDQEGTEKFAKSQDKLFTSYIISSQDMKTASAYAFDSISSEGGSGKTWRIYEGQSLPLLTSFMKAKGTVAVDYSYNGELTQGTTTTGIDNLTGKTGTAYTGYNTDPVSNPYKVYDAKTVLAETATAASAKYYGANATSDGVTLNNRKDVYAPTTDVHGNPVASSFALFSGGQQGYDLYGNNFKINQRTVTVSAETLNADKIYDGDTQKTYEGSALASTISGLIPSDTSVTLGGSITYTYADKNVGEDKAVEISHTALSLTGDGSSNYAADFSNIPTNTTGTISARKIAVSLVNPTGIDKTYDGSTVVRNENTTKDYTASGNIQFGASADQASDMDTAALLTLIGTASEHVALNKGSAAYTGPNVAFDGEGAVTSQDVTYTFSKTGNDAGNYVFTNADGTDLATAGQITGTGTIGQRTIESFGTAAVTTPYKTYDGLNYMTVSGSGSPVTIDDDLVSATDAEAGTTLTGMLENDATKVKFKTSGTVYFYDANGVLTSSASTSGLGTAATKASFDVALDADATGYDATVAKNYTWTAGAERTGNVIGKRDVTVALRWDSGIDKVYDGNEYVKDVTGGNAYATGNYQITSGSLVADATTSSTPTIGISGTPTYSSKDVAYDGVTPKAKSIAYTIAISGAAAGNYNLKTATNTTNTTNTVGLTASGTISPAPLTVGVSLDPNDPTSTNIDKVYDGNSDADKTRLVVSGWVGSDTQATQFDLNAVSAQYGNGSSDAVTFSPQTAVGTYDVKFSGLKTALKSSNYTISNTLYGRGAIATKHITLSQLEEKASPKNTVLAKVYDGGTGYDGTLNAAEYLSIDYAGLGVLAGDVTSVINEMNQKITIAQVIYDGKDVGSYTNNVTMKYNIGSSTSGTMDIGNYVFDMGQIEKTNQNGQINQRPVQVALNSNANPTKVYDGGNTLKANGTTIDGSTIKSWFNLSAVPNDAKSGIVTGEAIEMDATTLQGSYADAAGNAGIDQAVNYSGLQLTNTTNPTVNPASNYKLVNTSGASVTQIQGIGTITARRVQVASVGDVDKTYGTGATLEAVTATPNITLTDGEGDGNSVLGDENKNIITSLDDVQGSYGTLSGSSFTVDGNVKRASSTASAEKKDVRYSGVENFLGSNYVLVENNTGTVNGDTATTNPIVVKGMNGEYYVYGKGTIEPASKNVTVTAITKEYDGSDKIFKDNLEVGAISSESWWDNIKVKEGKYYDQNARGDADLAETLVLAYEEGTGGPYNYNVEIATPPTKGTITARKLYAFLDEDDRVDLTKTYDGTDTVQPEPDIKNWVKLTDSSLEDIQTINDRSGIGINTAGIVVKYADKNVALDANGAATDKPIYFSAIDLANNTSGNYELVLPDVVGTPTGTKFTTTGKINKKPVSLSITAPAIEKFYDEEGAVISADNKTSFETALTNSVTTWKTANLTGSLAEDASTFGLDTSGLTGVYGAWNPSSGNFTTDANVHREGGDATGEVLANTHDVLYYGFKLNDASTQNYELANATDYTVDGAVVDGASLGIGNTVYFQEAARRGTIRPLAISLSRVKEKWEIPVTKVYDGQKSILGYDTDGNLIQKTAKDYLTIYYDKDDSGDYNTGDIKITYNVANAEYGDANADSNKAFSYSGFSFSNTELGNYNITGGSLTGKYAHGATSSTTGNIARRLLVVSTDKEAHERNYNGNTALFDGARTYDVAEATSANESTGVVKFGGVNDEVSVTYVANFADKNVNFNEGTQTVDNKPVTYTFTLDGAAKDNYELSTGAAYPVSHTGETWVAGEGKLTKIESDGKILQREVSVGFADGVDGTFNKTYDKQSTLIGADGKLLADGYTDKTMANILSLTGVYDADNEVALDFTAGKAPTANYVDANGDPDANVAFNDEGDVTTKKVYIQNFNLTGTGATNYVVKAVKKPADTDPTDTSTLEGRGTIGQRNVTAVMKDPAASISKTYDTTPEVMDSNNKSYEERKQYAVGNAGRYLNADDHITIADGVTVSDGLAAGDTIADVQIQVVSALYYKGDDSISDAGDGLGVTYKLKWDNKNYNLVQTPLYSEGELKTTGNITPKSIMVSGTPTITKTYDGNDSVTNTSNLVKELFGDGVYEQDRAGLLTVDSTSKFNRGKDVYGNEAEINAANASDDAEEKLKGSEQGVTVVYTLNKNSNDTYNYVLEGGNTGGTYNGTGRIDRAKVTMTPTEVTYYPDQVANATYTGHLSSTGAAYDGAVTFGRDENTSMAVGNYTLLGYVNGQKVGTNNTFVDGIGNYYFVTAPNQALHVEAKADVADAVHRDTIADKKFIPDDYSYNRMSQDEDLTRLKRESQATVQYTEKGVNTDESSQGGLISSMDIQGAGSVVNLNGAVIQTSAKPEKPEEIAAEAALPVSETSESDFSSIDVENTDESGGSSSMLEILTNASNNAENRGTSIVINTMDEDEEDAEEEKNHRALIVDRSNIGIETLGDAVNLDQMIG